MRKRSAAPAALILLSMLAFLGALVFLVITAISGLVNGTAAMTPSVEKQIISLSASQIMDALNQGRTAEADGLFAQTTRALSGEGSLAYSELADEITRRGRPTDAARYLVSATKDDTINWDPNLWWTLAQAQHKANDPEEAAKSEAEADKRADTIRQSIGKKSSSGHTSLSQQEQIAHLIQGGSYYSEVKGDISSALPLMEEALRLAPDNAISLNALGYMLADKGTTTADFDRAAELTKKALTFAPNEPMILDSYGWALFKKNDLEGARRVLREAVESEPDIADIHYHMGVVYAQLGLTTDARIELDRALVLNPESKEAQEAMKRLSLPPGQGVLEHA